MKKMTEYRLSVYAWSRAVHEQQQNCTHFLKSLFLNINVLKYLHHLDYPHFHKNFCHVLSWLPSSLIRFRATSVINSSKGNCHSPPCVTQPSNEKMVSQIHFKCIMFFPEWKSQTARTDLTFSPGSYHKEILRTVKESSVFKSQKTLPINFLESSHKSRVQHCQISSTATGKVQLSFSNKTATPPGRTKPQTSYWETEIAPAFPLPSGL